MPELFIALFFLFYLKDNSGFSGSLGTSLGSVIFNSLIIPSVAVYNVILFSKKDIVPVSKKVILRDGLWLLAVEILLIVIIKDSIIKKHNSIHNLSLKHNTDPTRQADIS